MSGKHYKGQEVSCCIKYFIFGFNIIFWVRACVCSTMALFIMHQCFFMSMHVNVSVIFMGISLSLFSSFVPFVWNARSRYILYKTGIICRLNVDLSIIVRWACSRRLRSCICVHINSFLCDLISVYLRCSEQLPSQVRTTDNRLSLCEAMHRPYCTPTHGSCVLDWMQ